MGRVDRWKEALSAYVDRRRAWMDGGKPLKLVCEVCVRVSVYEVKVCVNGEPECFVRLWVGRRWMDGQGTPV